MASFQLLVYFPFRYYSVLVTPGLFYTELTEEIFDHFNIGSSTGNRYLLQIYDAPCKLYVEFDDEYINRLRQRLPRTSIENVLARIVPRQQFYLLSQQSFFSLSQERVFSHHLNLFSATSRYSPPPYLIVWLDEYFAEPANFRSMKRYLFTATLPEAPICNSFWDQPDISNLIQDDRDHDLDLCGSDSHLKMFMDIDQCRHYINSRENRLIVLITSDRIGRRILPSINDQIFSTYVLTNFWNDFEWGLDYIEGIQMFDDDQCMLARVIRDLARHYVDEAAMSAPQQALNYLHWAKKLYIQADRGSLRNSFRSTSVKLTYIDDQLDYLETNLKAWNIDCEYGQEVSSI